MTLFFRLLETDDKGTALHQAIQQLAQKQPNPNTFAVEPASFQQVPGSPFAYWVSGRTLSLFSENPSFENDERIVRQGLSTADDFRFASLWWEVSNYVSGWFGFAKGGAFSKIYFDFHLIVNWGEDGSQMKAWASSLYNNSHWSRIIKNVECYFRPGLTYPRRSQKGLSIRAMSQGCIFADKGPAIFVEKDDSEQLLALLAVTNSSTFRLLVELQMAFGSYEVGVIQRTPVPNLIAESTTTLATLARRAWSLKRSLDTVTQISHAFVLPALLQVNSSSLSDCSLNSLANAWTDNVTAVETELAHIQTQIDDLVFDLYGISEEVGSGQQAVGSEEKELDLPPTANRLLPTNLPTDEEEESESIAADLPSLTSELLAYLLSVAFGRFDVRLATGDRPHPSEPEPFDPLPVCSPGMLVGDNGIPAIAPAELPPDYPIQIPFDGILVDDEGHSNDMINRIRDVLNVIWGEQESDIEQEACHLLSTNGLRVSSLRDYFRKPTAFFNDHLSRYSKSRRQAPIYLPLSTRGNYTLWLYYHRLTDQTLYTCINDYVEPKLARVKEQIEAIRRAEGSRQRAVESKQNAEDSEQKSELPTHKNRLLPTANRLLDLQDLESELEDFRHALQRIAQFWKPNLNDGVQITLSPLWSLFRLGKWQKKLKETWDKLEKGDYDWAHLAHSIWAKRVEEKCKKDKSLAIAHDLEHLYETPPETPKSTKRKKKE